MQRQRVTHYVVLSILGGMCLYVGIFLWASHSESFEFVDQTLRHSKKLRSKLGDIQDVQLSPFGSFSEKIVGSDKNAKMKLKVIGTKKSIILEIKASKSGDIWKIDEAFIGDKRVPI